MKTVYNWDSIPVILDVSMETDTAGFDREFRLPFTSKSSPWLVTFMLNADKQVEVVPQADGTLGEFDTGGLGANTQVLAVADLLPAHPE